MMRALTSSHVTESHQYIQGLKSANFLVIKLISSSNHCTVNTVVENDARQLLSECNRISLEISFPPGPHAS